MMLIAWARPAIACAKVAMMMMQSSTPSNGQCERGDTGGRGRRVHTHAFTADDIGEPPKDELSHESADGGGDFYAQVLVL
jgi:hypothetical protein